MSSYLIVWWWSWQQDISFSKWNCILYGPRKMCIGKQCKPRSDCWKSQSYQSAPFASKVIWKVSLPEQSWNFNMRTFNQQLQYLMASNEKTWYQSALSYLSQTGIRLVEQSTFSPLLIMYMLKVFIDGFWCKVHTLG